MPDEVIDERRHAFFIVDNALVLEYAAKIGSNALALYVILACHASADTGTCYPSVKRLSVLMGRSRTIVFESIETLKANSLLLVEQRTTAGGGQASNLYRLLPLPGTGLSSSTPVHIPDGGVQPVDTPCPNAVPPLSIYRTGGVRYMDTEQDSVNKTESNKTQLTEEKEAQAPSVRAIRPTERQLADYFRENGSTGSEARCMWDYYQSNGWKVGRNPMRDWQATARNWIRRKLEEASKSNPLAIRPDTSLTDGANFNRQAVQDLRARGLIRGR